MVAAVVVVAAVAYVATEVANDTSDDTSDESSEDEAPKAEPKPTPRGPAPKDDTRTGGDCSSGSGGWVKHGDLDAKNGNRSTGATACLTESYLDTHEGSDTNVKVVAPPGYQWARRTAFHFGLPAKTNINACHLLGQQLSGSGTQLENLATCARGANDWQTGSQQGDNNMKNYENQVRAAVDAGQAVYYQVTPTYSGRRTVPTGFRISAYGTNPDGSTGIKIDAFVSNTLLNRRNLGMFNDQNTGRQVPTGGMP
ncbi:DNA/RNA non-specific endonuclease [Streptomyces chartreusis]|uniref:DNA/RNA non-specific endonuclease n=1 Tax=Streptomyces chartreusis TaxID=1969 RepID=UPI003629117A